MYKNLRKRREKDGTELLELLHLHLKRHSMLNSVQKEKRREKKQKKTVKMWKKVPWNWCRFFLLLFNSTSIDGSACTVRRLYNFRIKRGSSMGWGAILSCSDRISAFHTNKQICSKVMLIWDLCSENIPILFHTSIYIAIQPSQTSQFIYCCVNELRSPVYLDNIYSVCSF